GPRARGISGGRTGTVTVIQRTWSGLNANPDIHTLAFDGGLQPRALGRARVSPSAGPQRRRGRGRARPDPRHGLVAAGAPGLEPGDDTIGPADRLAADSP